MYEKNCCKKNILPPLQIFWRYTVISIFSLLITYLKIPINKIEYENCLSLDFHIQSGVIQARSKRSGSRPLRELSSNIKRSQHERFLVSLLLLLLLLSHLVFSLQYVFVGVSICLLVSVCVSMCQYVSVSVSTCQ